MAEPFRIPTIPEIRAWVESLPPDEIVGTCNNEAECLIATAATALNGGLRIAVSPFSGVIGPLNADGYISGKRAMQLSEELDQLAVKFDLMEAGRYLFGTRRVTAAEVLERWDELVQP